MLRRLSLAVLFLAAAAVTACSNPMGPSPEAPTTASADELAKCQVTNGSSIC